jgi:predicted nucleic acid-binding protein
VRLVVDANILVGELLRVRGRTLIAHADLELFVAEQAWNEARHELDKHVLAIAKQARLGEEAALNLLHFAYEAADRHVTVVNLAEYSHLHEEALRRIPQDPDDWPTVALAMALEEDYACKAHARALVDSRNGQKVLVLREKHPPELSRACQQRRVGKFA